MNRKILGMAGKCEASQGKRLLVERVPLSPLAGFEGEMGEFSTSEISCHRRARAESGTAEWLGESKSASALYAQGVYISGELGVK